MTLIFHVIKRGFGKFIMNKYANIISH